MSRFSFLLLFSCFGLLQAQPVLQWAPPPGTGYSADLVAGDFIEPTPGGEAAQAWDFSGVSGSTVGLSVVAPASTSPFEPLFEGAEWVSETSGQLAFWAMVEGGFTIFGNANAAVGITLPFLDPLVQWSYPLEMGGMVEDDFGLEQMLFAQPYSLQGNVSSVVDAWGSMMMPDGTSFPEVLRVAYSQFYTETYEGDTANWYLDQYMYFVPDSALPVFFQEELIVTDNGDNVLLEVSDVAWYSNVVLSVPDEQGLRVADPFPNPVMRGEGVKWPLARGWSWSAVDVEGRVMAQGRVNEGDVARIETAGWSSGLVLLTAEGPQGQRVVNRLMVH